MQPVSRVVSFMSRLTSRIGLDFRIESNKDTFGLFFENEWGAKSYRMNKKESKLRRNATH
jgi:hypothetical protein